MKLYFIRHGQSQNNANWGNASYQESSDPALTETGVQQASLLARFLADNQDLHPNPGWDPNNSYGFGISRFDISQTELTVCYLNRTDHFPTPLVTG
jgi:bisphosphoglycerate-dependent phosphoglycerate mutase